MVKTDSRYKLKQLILHVASRMRDAEYFGATKLNKILYRAEHTTYRELGQKLTTFQYQKNPHGPTLRAFLPVTSEMREEGLISFEDRPVGQVTERRIVALMAADLRVFSSEELKIIDQEVDRAWHLTGGQVSDEEHETAAWYATRLGETIKPELSFVENPGNLVPFSHEEEERAGVAIERFLARTRSAARNYS
jgi:hypothetical protein